MKIVAGESGSTYGLAVAYGVLNQLEGLVFETLSDEVMEKVKGRIAEQGGEMDDLRGAALMAFFSGSDMREFLKGNATQGGRLIATVLRTVDGAREVTVEGTAYNLRSEADRLDYVNEVLPFPDGEAIVDAVNDIMESFAKGNKKAGKSELSSSRGRRKAVVPSPESS